MEEENITPSDGTQAPLPRSSHPRQRPPRRDAPRLVRVTAHQQYLQLMGLQLMDRAVRRPIGKAALRQALVTDPKALTVVRQNLHGGAPSIAENEQPATEGIGMKMRTAHPRQTIDAGAKVDARHGHQDAHLRRELNHAAPQ